MRQQEPLTQEELDGLQRQERQTTWFHVAAMGALFLGGAVAYRYDNVGWFRGLLLVVVAVLVVAATVLQLRERCPRCRARLRRKLLLALPEKCGACGVSLQRPPAHQGG
jgi:hypothetical protein